MNNSEEQKVKLSKSEIIPAPIPVQTSEPIVAKRRQLLTCSVLTGGSALVAAIILFGSYQLCRWHICTENEKILVLGKIQCNRVTSSNQLYEALKASPRSSWPPVTTINRREYVCISTYKIDVTDLRDRQPF